jgi:membrane protease YdiL (CAAX protease family)
VGEIASWGVIFLFIALVVVRTTATQLLTRDEKMDDMAFRTTCQMTLGLHLGVHALLGNTAPAAPGGAATPMSNMDTQLLDQLDRAAQTPGERFRVAIMVGELVGPEQALERMKTLANESPDLRQDVETATELYGGQAVAPGTWAAFQKKYGWFADLLASARKPPDDAGRIAALSPGYRILVALAALVVCVGPLILAGMILLIIGIVQMARGRIKLAFSPDEDPKFVKPVPAFPVVSADATMEMPTPDATYVSTPVRADRRSYLFGFALYLGTMLGASLMLGLILRLIFQLKLGASISMIASLVVTCLAFVLGVGLPLLLGQSFGQWREALGLHRGRGIWREIGSGILGYVAGLPVLAAGIVIVSILSQLSGLKASHPINDELNGSGVELFAVFFLACVMAPITEELMFRGALFAHLRERFGWWISAPAAAFVFAIIHPQGWVALPALGALALVFAGIREWRGSIIGCMTAHALHNGLTLAYAIMLLRQGQ